jgi:hypothetical protein
MAEAPSVPTESALPDSPALKGLIAFAERASADTSHTEESPHVQPTDIHNASSLALLERRGSVAGPDRVESARVSPQASQALPLALVPLHLETRAALPTPEAARHLGRQPQTLRLWACNEDGPLRPLRIHGRLAWPVADLRKLLGVGQ